MRILVWLVRAALFFAAVRLCAEQPARCLACAGSSASSGSTPMVFVVLAAFALGCAFGVVGHAAELVAASPRGAPPRARQTSPTRTDRHLGASCQPTLAGTPAARWTLTCSGCCWACRWPSRFGWLALALRPAPVEARTEGFAEGLLQGPEPAAQRAARQGDRRLHRGRAARPRHLRPALRAGQPVPPPRRIRARRARARAPAATAPTCLPRSASAPSTRWRRTS